jgi:hypothetical protein
MSVVITNATPCATNGYNPESSTSTGSETAARYTEVHAQ